MSEAWKANVVKRIYATEQVWRRNYECSPWRCRAWVKKCHLCEPGKVEQQQAFGWHAACLQCKLPAVPWCACKEKTGAAQACSGHAEVRQRELPICHTCCPTIPPPYNRMASNKKCIVCSTEVTHPYCICTPTCWRKRKLPGYNAFNYKRYEHVEVYFHRTEAICACNPPCDGKVKLGHEELRLIRTFGLCTSCEHDQALCQCERANVLWARQVRSLLERQHHRATKEDRVHNPWWTDEAWQANKLQWRRLMEPLLAQNTRQGEGFEVDMTTAITLPFRYDRKAAHLLLDTCPIKGSQAKQVLVTLCIGHGCYSPALTQAIGEWENQAVTCLSGVGHHELIAKGETRWLITQGKTTIPIGIFPDRFDEYTRISLSKIMRDYRKGCLDSTRHLPKVKVRVRVKHCKCERHKLFPDIRSNQWCQEGSSIDDFSTEELEELIRLRAVKEYSAPDAVVETPSRIRLLHKKALFRRDYFRERQKNLQLSQDNIGQRGCELGNYMEQEGICLPRTIDKDYACILHRESIYCTDEIAFQWPNVELDHNASTELSLLLDTLCNLLTRKFISVNQQIAPDSTTWLMIPKPKLTLSPVKGVTVWCSNKKLVEGSQVNTEELRQFLVNHNRQHPFVEMAVKEVSEHLVACKADIRAPIEQRIAIVLHKGTRLTDQWVPTDRRARAHPI